MSKEREILQRFQSGMSQRNIALGLHVSRNTVAKVVAAYKSSNISKEALDAIDGDELHRKLYPDEVPSISARMPDYGYVHKELLKPGVTLQKKQALHTINRSSAQSLPVNLSGRLFTRFSGKRAYKGSLTYASRTATHTEELPSMPSRTNKA